MDKVMQSILQACQEDNRLYTVSRRVLFKLALDCYKAGADFVIETLLQTGDSQTKTGDSDV